MKNVLKSLSVLSKQISEFPGCFLILDFDGTLSAIAQTPARAFLPKKTQRLIKKISLLIPIAVVSGRKLSDIKKRVMICGLIYAGNHGLEWEIDGQVGSKKIPALQRRALSVVKKRLLELEKNFPGVILEDKKLSMSLHYRLLKKNLEKKLLTSFRKILLPFQKSSFLKIIHGKKVLEIRPILPWNKGDMVNFLRKKIGLKLLPIYLGDDSTDEDAFAALRNGLTIKVGYSKNSLAKYYCAHVKEAYSFLNWLVKEI